MRRRKIPGAQSPRVDTHLMLRKLTCKVSLAPWRLILGGTHHVDHMRSAYCSFMLKKIDPKDGPDLGQKYTQRYYSPTQAVRQSISI